jgi:hypothetical protein
MLATRLSPLLAIEISNWLGMTAPSPKTIVAPSSEKFRTRQSTVDGRLLNKILAPTRVKSIGLILRSSMAVAEFEQSKSRELREQNIGHERRLRRRRAGPVGQFFPSLFRVKRGDARMADKRQVAARLDI